MADPKTSKATRLQRESKASSARELFRIGAPVKVDVLAGMLENFDEEDQRRAKVRYYNGSMIVEVPAEPEPEMPLQ